MFGKKKETEQAEITNTWNLYVKGKEYLSKSDHFINTDECYRFFNGDQWDGLESGGERLPVLNIIKPIVNYKTAVVTQNLMTINYSPDADNKNEYDLLNPACKALNTHARQTWENLKMDRKCWELVEDSCVSGDAYIYFYDENGVIKMDAIDTTNIFFGDEQQRDLQKQPYILITGRYPIADLRATAKKNGLSKDDIDKIVADDEKQYQAGDAAKEEVDAEDETMKATAILKLWKKDGEVHIMRSTQNVEFQVDTAIKGMKMYPIAAMSWSRKKGSARGESEVVHLIPNQLEINKAQARFDIGMKHYAFPHLVYDADKIADTKSLSVVGADIAMENVESIGDIDKMIRYLQVPQIPTMARDLAPNLAQITRELAGAGESVTGQIDPEKASGASIIAVRDAAAMPLNTHVSAFRQFIEDIALIWFDMWVAYHQNGFRFMTEDDQNGVQFYFITPEVMQQLKIRVRIDVSPANPYSKYAKEKALENLLTMGAISFEEYVDALDTDSAAPKGKLDDIVKKRKQQMALTPQNPALTPQLQQTPTQQPEGAVF